MKKYLIALAFSFLILMPSVSFAWDDCIFDEVQCEYPGECPRYIDTDGDGVCDHSESAPIDRVNEAPPVELNSFDTVDSSLAEPALFAEELALDADLISGQDLKTKTVAEVAEIYGINSHDYAHALREYIDFAVEPDTSFLLLHDNYALEPSVAKEIALSVLSGNTEEITQIVAAAELEQSSRESVYNFVPLSLILLALYLLTWLLAKFNKIKLLNHRKLWNWLLLATFLASGLSGIFLVLRINYGFIVSWPFNLLEIHVETGIAMAMISIFHIVWHWPYYLGFLLKKKK